MKMNTYQKFYTEYLSHFRRMTDQELVKARNEAVYFPGVDVLHKPYMDAILQELQSRDIDCSVLQTLKEDERLCEWQRDINVLLRVINGKKTLIRFDRVKYYVFPN